MKCRTSCGYSFSEVFAANKLLARGMDDNHGMQTQLDYELPVHNRLGMQWQLGQV